LNALVRSNRLEHDEVKQLGYVYRSTSVARDRAWGDVKGWRRVIDRFEDRDPDRKTSISLSR
jgi:hypothetical protein